MLYAQFYQRGVISGALIEACGDRSVIILDGRVAPATNGEIAASECLKRGFEAWAIFRGETFTRSSRVSQVNYVSRGKPDNSASSAYWGA